MLAFLMDVRCRGVAGRGATGKDENDQHACVPAQIPAAPNPDPVKHAAVLGPVKAKPYGWPRKTRPALTAPARGGCEIWRSGWKNARGTGRTKEWIRKDFNCQIDRNISISMAWTAGRTATHP